ncbi:MAG: hypothetical protein H6552_00480 [Chitinophagales bacterium]|nr:hypothetical protein [Chitinophagales bacterium]
MAEHLTEVKANDLLQHLKDAIGYEPVLAVVYSDGKDYSHLKKSAYCIDPEHECNQCGSTLVTELENKDICHDCGFVYT